MCCCCGRGGTDAYNRYILERGPTNSTAALIVRTPEAAADPFVVDKIRKTEAIFFCGGRPVELHQLLEGYAAGGGGAGTDRRGVSGGRNERGIGGAGAVLFFGGV